jgi:hypothetical protein
MEDGHGGPDVGRRTPGRCRRAAKLELLTGFLMKGMQLLEVLFGLLFVVSLGVMVGQAGFRVLPALAAPNWERVDPMLGMGRLFSLPALLRGGAATAKVAITLVLAVVLMKGRLARLATFDQQSLSSAATQTWHIVLILGLFRLALNVATTRLILLKGSAGHIVSTFGNFVVGGSLVVGLVIFLILIIIQFVVITKGAGRISEVAARFTLDALPGKQVALDAELNSGAIDENEARRRRQQLLREAEFYGAIQAIDIICGCGQHIRLQCRDQEGKL